MIRVAMTYRLCSPPTFWTVSVPIDIFEAKVGDFAAPQAEIGEAPQHREGAPMGPERRIE
jgi:hypothetical protein